MKVSPVSIRVRGDDNGVAILVGMRDKLDQQVIQLEMDLHGVAKLNVQIAKVCAAMAAVGGAVIESDGTGPAGQSFLKAMEQYG